MKKKEILEVFERGNYMSLDSDNYLLDVLRCYLLSP